MVCMIESLLQIIGLAAAAAILVPLLIEAVLILVLIGLVLWKRIKVAKFLYNLQLPKLTDLPQAVIRWWRPASSPPPDSELAVLDTCTQDFSISITCLIAFAF